MDPTEYEHHVADVLRAEGWTAVVTPPSNDGGIDLLATRPGRRLGVQAKMYGTSRRVNQQAVHELFGAGTAQECTEFMIATDGELTSEAAVSADRLGVVIRRIPAASASRAPDGDALTFGHVWTHVRGLEGTTLRRTNGSENDIITVDEGGVWRRTSGGTKQMLEIEIFRWTVDRLLAGKTVTRDEINEHYAKRGSSGVVLILAALPMFETTKVGRKIALQRVAE